MNLYSFFPGEFPIAGACEEKRDQQFPVEGKEKPAREKKKNLQRNEIFHFIWSVR